MQYTKYTQFSQSHHTYQAYGSPNANPFNPSQSQNTYLSVNPSQSYLIKIPFRASAELCIISGEFCFVSSFWSCRACWSRRPSLSELPWKFQGPHATITMTYQMRRTQMVRFFGRRENAQIARRTHRVVALSSL